MMKITCFSIFFAVTLLLFSTTGVSAIPVDEQNRQDSAIILVGIGNATALSSGMGSSVATTPSHPHYLPPQIASYPSTEKPKNDNQNQKVDEGETERRE